MSQALLTKSTFLQGCQCPKWLWLEVHDPTCLASATPAQQRVIEEGNQVGAYVREQFPDGVLITESGQAAIAATRRAITAGATVIFEATFQHADVLVRCDILERAKEGEREPDSEPDSEPDREPGWNIIEVKASTKVKPEHVTDLAIQRYVLTHSGLKILATRLMHINREGNATAWFDSVDLSQEVSEAIATVEENLARFTTLLQGEKPTQSIGAHCRKPNPCPAQSVCWAAVPEPSIFSIPRLHAKKQKMLIEQGIFAIADLPPSFQLTATQATYVRSLQTQEPTIDHQAIRQALAQLIYPLYFFDFETLNPALPRFEGMRPYQAFPFQYSCHVLQADGTVTHWEYLHTDSKDPRRSLSAALCQHLGEQGSIVVYHAPFERSILKQLAEQVPEYQSQLSAMVGRLWDQLEIFKHHYHHPQFGGSTSIKKVLPVLVPQLSYDQLAVQKGDQAQAQWEQLVREPDKQRKSTLVQELKDYCCLDTEAMLAIHRVLAAL